MHAFLRRLRFVSTLLLVAGLSLWAAPRARAQECVNDTPPRPSDVAATPCDDPSVCPGPANDANHYLGGTIVSFPATPTDLGSCNTAAPGAYGNGCTDSRASCITGGDAIGHCLVQYKGLMYRPSGAAAEAPAVLLVPGSSACVTIDGVCFYRPEPFCGIKSALLARGYVVMEVLPRGYGIDAAHRSTGYYIDNQVSQENAMGAPCVDRGPGGCSTHDLIQEGLQDVARAYTYLANRPFVNASAVGVFGHSLGGIRALAFNRHDHGQKATVTIAPASESWCFGNGTNNTLLWDEMLKSVDMARSATYTFQPQNDVNLESGTQIAHEAAQNRWQYQAAFFPPVTTATGEPIQYGDEAHSCFVTNQRSVDMWFPSVLDFFRRYGVK